MKGKQRERYEQVGEFVSLFRRGEQWYVHFRVDGKPCRQSLGTTNKKQAHRKALAIERDLVDGKAVRHVRAPKIEEVIERYMSHLRALGRSRKTLAKYSFGFRLVLEVASELHISRIDQIDLAFVDQFRQRRVRYKNVKQPINEASDRASAKRASETKNDA